VPQVQQGGFLLSLTKAKGDFMKDLMAYHSRMNLQLFAEGDPIDPPIDPPAEPPVDPAPTDPPADPPQMVKIKFNHEEKELTVDEAALLAQKGMNYDKVYERMNALQNDPALAFVESMAKKYNMSPEEYVTAAQKQLEQQELDSLVQQNIPEEYAKEMLESRKFRQQSEQEKQSKKAEEDKKSELAEFVKAYPGIKPEDIPQSVWDDVGKGLKMIDAYTRHENQSLKSEIAKLNEKLNINAANEQNTKSSTGSIKGDGKLPQGFYSREQVAAMSQSEIASNLDAINESMKKW
jgi:hypothetical protein